MVGDEDLKKKRDQWRILVSKGEKLKSWLRRREIREDAFCFLSEKKEAYVCSLRGKKKVKKMIKETRENCTSGILEY